MRRTIVMGFYFGGLALLAAGFVVSIVGMTAKCGGDNNSYGQFTSSASTAGPSLSENSACAAWTRIFMGFVIALCAAIVPPAINISRMPQCLANGISQLLGAATPKEQQPFAEELQVSANTFSQRG